jgi:hypothetical protein
LHPNLGLPGCIDIIDHQRVPLSQQSTSAIPTMGT